MTKSEISKGINGKIPKDCVKLALMHVARSIKQDPFLDWFSEYGFEENDFCQGQGSNNLNLQLTKTLKKLRIPSK
jgi:hypothetical protein